MRFLSATCCAALISACQISAPGAPAVAPKLGPECTGPGPGNFNGAPLTAAVIAGIPQQFEQDRVILRAVLDGSATADQVQFAKMCHGLTVR